MIRKKNVLVIFGGQSAEHEVSIRSARNIVMAINRSKYNLSLIGIDKKGTWLSKKSSHLLLYGSKGIIKNKKKNTKEKSLNLFDSKVRKKIDVVFPVLHGPFGEDGTMQGFLKLLGLPFVGPGVLGSSLGMDKDAMKRMLRESRIRIANFITIRSNEVKNINFNEISSKLGSPIFIKPANMGSSIGVTKALNKKQFLSGIKNAFQYDNKVIIEEFIKGREIECSVLGNNGKVIASIPGEVIPQHDFYTYDAKYLDDNGAILNIPAQLSAELINEVKNIAIKTFQALNCEGMSRIDFFITPKNEVIVNEINTIPGFTSISMYPKLFEASGIGSYKLIDKLLDLAIERYDSEKKLKVNL